ncbi:unnamed protein product [Coregonus sp. 'balchen']|nr:unnamed protein product [Coregonus sp. 'balchen']
MSVLRVPITDCSISTVSVSVGSALAAFGGGAGQGFSGTTQGSRGCLVNVVHLKTGTVLLPGTSQLTARDMLHRLQTSEAHCVITDESLAPLLDAVASQCSSLQHKLLVSPTKREGWMNFGDLCVETRSYDPMTIFFTSGTTGSPKMTQHSHSSYGIGLTVNVEVLVWPDGEGCPVEHVRYRLGQVCLEQCLRSLGVFIHNIPCFDSHTVLELPHIHIMHGSNCLSKTSARGHVQCDPERTEECYIGDFYLTGYRFVMDEDGYLGFVG